MPGTKRRRIRRPPNPFATPEIRAALSVIGRKGGRASMTALTPEQRQERARKAAEARWGKTGRRRRTPGL